MSAKVMLLFEMVIRKYINPPPPPPPPDSYAYAEGFSLQEYGMHAAHSKQSLFSRKIRAGKYSNGDGSHFHPNENCYEFNSDLEKRHYQRFS